MIRMGNSITSTSFLKDVDTIQIKGNMHSNPNASMINVTIIRPISLLVLFDIVHILPSSDFHFFLQLHLEHRNNEDDQKQNDSNGRSIAHILLLKCIVVNTVH